MREYGVGVGSVGVAESGNLSRELTVEAESGVKEKNRGDRDSHSSWEKIGRAHV